MLTPLPASASTTALMFSATVSGDALICWCIASLPHSRGSAWRGGTRPRTAHPTRASGPWEALDGRGLAPYWALGGVGSFTIRRARENGLGVRRGRWSGRRGSNPRHSAWEADTLPTELLPLGRLVILRNATLPGQSRASASWRRIDVRKGGTSRGARRSRIGP